MCDNPALGIVDTPQGDAAHLRWHIFLSFLFLAPSHLISQPSCQLDPGLTVKVKVVLSTVHTQGLAMGLVEWGA